MTQPGSEEGVTCLVIGPIGNRLAEPGSAEHLAYEEAIATLDKIIVPACTEVGINAPIRADQISTAGEIPDQVFRLIRDADIVIADVTGGNPNVMYELGVRHTKHKLTLQIGEQEKLPFDITTVRTIQFRRTEGGYIDAKNDLRRALEVGLAGNFDPVTVTRIWMEEEVSVGQAIPPAAVDEPSGDGDEGEGPPGYLELIVEAEDTMPRIVDTLEKIVDVTKEFGALAEQGTQEIEEIDRRGQGARGRLVVAIRFAERLDGPVKTIEALASSYRADVSLIEPAFDYIFGAVERREFAPDEINEIVTGLGNFTVMGEAASQAMPAIRGFRDSVQGIAGSARPVRTRAERLISALDSIVQSSTKFEQFGRRASQLREEIQTEDGPDSDE